MDALLAHIFTWLGVAYIRCWDVLSHRFSKRVVCNAYIVRNWMVIQNVVGLGNRTWECRLCGINTVTICHHHSPIISGAVSLLWTACRVAIAKAAMRSILLAAFWLLIFQSLDLSTAVACTTCLLSSESAYRHILVCSLSSNKFCDIAVRLGDDWGIPASEVHHAVSAWIDPTFVTARN